MLKLHKYLRLTRSLPLKPSHRFVSSSRCPKDCPPRYECKQPEKSDHDYLLEHLKESMIPEVFVPHPPKEYRVYRNILFFLCIPVLICVYVNIFCLEKKERKRPKFVEFSYMRIRNKPFLWDPERTLFHNPRYNALPGGYEYEVPEDEEYDPFEPDKK